MPETPPTAAHTRVVEKPKSWEKCVLVAYLISTGMPNTKAAAAAGLTEHTVGGWRHSPWWGDAVDEAYGRWLKDVKVAAMGAIRRSLEKDKDEAQMGRWVGDRILPDLSPPAQRHNIDVSALSTSDLAKQLPDALKALGLTISEQGDAHGSDDEPASPETDGA